jgi:hypothetical protein
VTEAERAVIEAASAWAQARRSFVKAEHTSTEPIRPAIDRLAAAEHKLMTAVRDAEQARDKDRICPEGRACLMGPEPNGTCCLVRLQPGKTVTFESAHGCDMVPERD